MKICAICNSSLVRDRLVISELAADEIVVALLLLFLLLLLLLAAAADDVVVASCAADVGFTMKVLAFGGTYVCGAGETAVTS